MTKRLSMGVLFATVVVMLTAMSAFAERPGGKEWTGSGGIQNPMYNAELPLIFRTSAGTTWVCVNQNCADEDTANSPDGQTPDKVWCFEGASGDSSWPCVPAGQDNGTKKETYDHWSLFAPPLPPSSRWHITALDPSPMANAGNENGLLRGTNYNAWCGCDAAEVPGVGGVNVEGCDDVAFWVFQKGYGDDWNYALNLDLSSANANSGGTITFDLRYDTECNYDYLYLEYLDTGSGEWETITDGGGNEAVFNAVSGNPDNAHGGSGRPCGDDIYFHSDQFDFGGGPEPYYGNSVWLQAVSFPIPSQSGGIQFRWRGTSDGAWSDADGRGDTDGIGAIDNVTVDFVGAVGTTTYDFDSATAPDDWPTGWSAGGLEGTTYDGWHLSFDPMYANKGNTCTFSDDWMWAAKPDTGPISENGFQFYLVTPTINVQGWTGGVVEYSQYLCMNSDREDYINTLVKVYDTSAGGWSLWNDIDGFITFSGCEFWNFNQTDDITTFLTATVDSMQFAWVTLDISQDGEFSWGKHGGVQHLIDNVSVGEFNGEATQFVARNIDIFADTFSRADPAHTPFLQNPEQGDWTGTPGGSRDFANSDSLNVQVTDFNGVTEANVTMWWRHDDGGTLDLGSQPWLGPIAMDLGTTLPLSTSDEGTYRGIIGADNGGTEDQTGGASNGLIWDAGTSVDYYVKVVDNSGNTATFPNLTTGVPFQFSVLPLGNAAVDGTKILLVDDYTRNAIDFENSTGFDPNGGSGAGAFGTPAFAQPDILVGDALDLLYPTSNTTNINNMSYPHHFDKYDVQGGGSSVQCEPRGVSALPGVGGFMNDLGAPQYDALIWLQGTFDEYSYADTTRIALSTYLDNGGNLFSTGDEVSFHLGTAGNNADSLLGFIRDYLGHDFTNANDETTDNKVLNVAGVDSSYANVIYGLYGECPLRRTYDRITLTSPSAGSANSVLMEYADGGAGDNGRPAMILNHRTTGGGVAVHAAFGVETMLSRETIACLLEPLLTDKFGLPTPPGAASLECIINGVGSPVIANGAFGFDLKQAAPNPFATQTSIEFSVANRGHVSIEVYNILGQKVRTLVDETMDANSYVAAWDGRSDSGEDVSSGIYFYKMVAGEFSQTKKTVLLR